MGQLCDYYSINNNRAGGNKILKEKNIESVVFQTDKYLQRTLKLENIK